MRTMGRLTSVVVLVAVAVAVVVGVKSIPDVKRYLRMRKM